MDPKTQLIASRMTEFQAVEWLNARGVAISLRTLREMRARGEIGHYRLEHGRHRILYTEQHLVDAFIGEEILPGEKPSRVVPLARRRKQRAERRISETDRMLQRLTG